MKGISVILDGEKALFYWKDGKVYAEGYDLESEKMALALTGFGEGIGVLLAASNDCCKSEAEFISEVEMFVVGYKKTISNAYGVGHTGSLLFEYLSYSPDPSIRWSGLYHARLSERHYKRLLSQKEMKFKAWMARLPQLPEKYFHSLASLSRSEVNYALANNENCPIDLLEILAKDEDVRRYVAQNPNCPQRIIEILAKDENEIVRKYVTCNPHCPRVILKLLAQDQDEDVRLSAQYNLAKIKGLEV